MRLTTIALAFLALIYAVNADARMIEGNGFRIMTWSEFIDWICKLNAASNFGNLAALCNPTTTTSTAQISTTSAMDTTSTASTSSSSLIPVNQRDRWCQFRNGTYLSLGYTFMHTECALCQCTQSREILCTNLQCMPTQCLDGSTPTPKPGQCCPQCAYEKTSTPCVINGVTFPHGTILRQTSDNLQCWCQLGNVECRKSSASVFSGLDYFGNGTAAYVIVIIICVILIVGTLLCCSGTLLFYYFYKRRQQAAEQNYAEYYNNAGWQPMSEDGQVVDSKQAEATQNAYQNEYPTGHSEEFVPPPYAIYNSSYGHEQDFKDGK